MVDAGNSYKDKVSRLISWGHWFIFANIIIAMATASRYIVANGFPQTLGGFFYLLTNWMGHFAFLAMLLYVILLFPITFIIPYSKVMRAIGAILATLAIVVLLIDSSIYQNYHLHINLLIFDLKGFNLGNSIGWPTVVIFILALLAVELTLANLLWKRLHTLRKRNIGGNIASLFIGSFLLSHLIHIWADASVYQPIIKMDRMFPLSYPSTARSFMARQGWIALEEHQEKLRQTMPSQPLNYPLAPLQCTNPQRNDVLVIVVDSINAELFNPDSMPNLSQLATNSLYFRHHLSTSNQSDSSLFSLLTGLPASYVQAFHEADRPAAILSTAVSQGYRLADFGSDALTPVDALFERPGVDGNRATGTAAQRDLASTRAWLKWHSNTATQPALSRVTYHASSKFSTPDDFHRKITYPKNSTLSEKEQVLYRQYLQSLRFVDEQIGLLINRVDLSRTTVVVTASKGMETQRLIAGSDSFSPANVRVPLIISLPGQRPGQIQRRSSHYDIVPTLLSHHFGCSNPSADYSNGQDLITDNQTADEQPPASPLLFIGEGNRFALYQDQQISVIDRHGNYNFYDQQFNKKRDAKLSFQDLIALMQHQKRFYH